MKDDSEAAVPATSEEASLVSALQARDDTAAENLVRTHGPWMASVAMRIIADPELAQDCVQEAFLNAFRKIDDFEQRSTLKTWLHRIVVNQALMKLRAKRNRSEAQIGELLPEFDAYNCRVNEPRQQIPTPEEMLDREETRVLVHASIDQLPEAYRSILILRDIEELTTREVSELLGVSEGNVKVRLHRARSALKKLLQSAFAGGL